MFNPFKKKESLLDVEIQHVKDVMEALDPSTEEYKVCVQSLKELYECKNANRIDWKVWAPIIANLFGILLILHHEDAHVIASKAFGMIKKV